MSKTPPIPGRLRNEGSTVNVEGKVIAITGAAGGIGAAAARLLCGKGAVVWLLDLRREAVEKLAGELREKGGAAHAAELYFKHWGIESAFDLLKSKLQLENFSGKTVVSF